MATADQWREVVGELRAGREERERDIYRYALEDGRSRLRRQFRDFTADHDDLIHDVLARIMSRLVEFENPRAYFIRCLVNHATDATRKSREDLPGETLKQEMAPGGQESSLEMERVLLELVDGTQRDAQIYLAVVILGEDAETVGRAYGLTRENTYQIVSRTKKRLKSATGAD